MAKKKRRVERSNPSGEKFLGLSGKTWLILGGTAVAAIVVWKIMKARKDAAAAEQSRVLAGPVPQAWRPPGVPAAATGLGDAVRAAQSAPQSAPAPTQLQGVGCPPPDDGFGGSMGGAGDGGFSEL